MKENAGQRLPDFTKAEAEQVKGSFDFIGLNHYTSAYVKDSCNGPMPGLRDYNADMFATVTSSFPFSLPLLLTGQCLKIAPSKPNKCLILLQFHEMRHTVAR